MTRLADVTHLDVIGVPVVQAIRPWSRGLSVHQGKGLSQEAASLGALMEAVECHFAEAFAGPTVFCPFSALPAHERAATISDFASDRADAPGPDEALAWVEARTVVDDDVVWLPFDVVSLDFSRPGDRRLDRSSDGLACHFDRSDAVVTALLELVERDAVTGFLAMSFWERAGVRVDVSSAPFAWLAPLRERIAAAGISMRVYNPAAVMAAQVFVCELIEAAAQGLPRGRVFGSACHPCAETALRKALLEAVQSRLTAISGARDDLLFEPGREPFPTMGFAPPLPAAASTLSWRSVTERRPDWAPCAEDIAARLARAGYGSVAIVDLAPSGSDVAVVKAFVPGLGSAGRRRRSPAPAQ